MAGGKLTPRQKMINLMYLVFIAMLAMNMSKEVLSAFGLMNEKFESANTSSEQSNAGLLMSLDQKAAEAKGEFAIAAVTAHKVETASKEFYAYIGSLKGDVLKGFESDKETGKLPYESMDKGDNIDNWFTGEGYTAKGNDIIAHIEAYKAAMKAALADKKYAAIVAEIEKKFDVSDVKNKEGLKDKYLAYHFKGFPAVASLAKLSAWQNDVQKAESDVYSAALGKAAVAAASYSNYQAIVVLDKNAYFQGEKVTGKVVLGRYDENTKPTSFQGPGQIVNGQAVISLTAGGVGEQDINGQFTFLEDGKNIPLKFKGTYVVVPKPNSATISADKMNVVYRGVVNPISVSFAGVDANKIVASAPGLASAGKPGKYNMSPGSGTEATISVTGTLPNGDKVTDKKSFRIKGIPGPTGTIRGEMGVVKGPKSNLEIATIGAKLLDFDFEVGLDVVGFNLKIAGQPTVVVTGNKLSAQCKSVLAKAGRGDQVTISEIKTKLVGAGSYLLPRTAPVIYEIQ
ncbi:protein involved in gliding motility GldM [Flavobacterium aquidurense]|uniref:Gliding motility protein GldM n=1 Tax=Flavobacterium frigidimaris TaxID=262320 RepID=A0ABX4BQT1_FLAFR|nr:gliding motility protein GldM [Flavobacterium frigidimaris]OXA79518.1 gliding motility protein GldM [Flavobacterium frigidimaris]SDZ21963.1 protein involved in gliding motility GldM [Flavobacterium aquidurense]